MAITTSNQFDGAIAGAENQSLYKTQLASKGAGFFQSLWQAAGYPAAGAVPATGAGVIPTLATQGAMVFAAPGALTAYLSRLDLAATAAQTIFIADRLWHGSGLNGTLATAQAINGPTTNRNGAGVGNQLWLEIYAATGATAATLTVSYTNSAGVAGRSTTIAMPTSPVVGQMTPIPLAAGDVGIQSVQSATLSVSTGTAGNFGLTILQQTGLISVTASNVGTSKGAYETGMTLIDPNACLFPYVLCTSANTGTVLGGYSVAKG